MTRSDYEVIVKALREWITKDAPDKEARVNIVAQFMRALIEENPMFSPEKFAYAVFAESKEPSK